MRSTPGLGHTCSVPRRLKPWTLKAHGTSHCASSLGDLLLVLKSRGSKKSGSASPGRLPSAWTCQVYDAVMRNAECRVTSNGQS